MNRIRKRAPGAGLGLKPVVLLMVCLLAFVSCQKASEEGLTTLERIRAEGLIKVGYANEAPYAYFDSEANRLTGEAPEIAREVAKRMGVDRVEGVLTEFGSLIPGLKAKRFDVIAAGMYVLPERCKEIDFSSPTYKVGEAFLVKKGNPRKLHGYEDVAADPEARIGVVAGAVELGYARATGVPEERIAVLPDAPSAVAAVGAGRIDAYAGTSLTINDIMRKIGEGGLERAEPFTDPIIEGRTVIGYGAFGIRKEDRDLLDEFNRHLADFIGSDVHIRVVEPFGFTGTELPGDVTAERLCAGGSDEGP